MLKYVVFLKVVLLVLIYRTHTKYLMYSRQELAGSQRGFKGVIATGISPLLFRTSLAR